MYNAFLIYLAESTGYLAAFAFCYRFIFSKLTYFGMNRGYLIFTLLAGLSIPLLPVPDWNLNENVFPAQLQNDLGGNFKFLLSQKPGDNKALWQDSLGPNNWAGDVFVYLLLGIYLVGCATRLWYLSRSLWSIYRLSQGSEVLEITPRYTLRRQAVLPTFSFFNHIFLHRNTTDLSLDELGQIIDHERIHVDHRHSVDLLLFEFATVVFWFNPVIYYLRKSISLVHEFMVDASVTRKRDNVVSYSKLLVKLSTTSNVVPLMHGFSNKQLFQRILMLTKPKSSPMQKLKFLYALPVVATVVMLHACFDDSATGSQKAAGVVAKENVSSGDKVLIRKITWKGNTIHRADELTSALGIKEGDHYDKNSFSKKLYPDATGKDLSSLYMDKGYLFFRAEEKAVPVDGGVDLEIHIDEGEQFNIGNVVIRGNKKVATEEVKVKTGLKTGELFSRMKLIHAQRYLAESGYFNPNEVNINPIPDLEHKTVDLEFVVKEL